MPSWAWAKIDGDPRTHVARPTGYGFLCGVKPLLGNVTVIVMSIPEPKLVTCEDCLARGAYNVPRPPSGHYQSPTHSATVLPM